MSATWGQNLKNFRFRPKFGGMMHSAINQMTVFDQFLHSGVSRSRMLLFSWRLVKDYVDGSLALRYRCYWVMQVCEIRGVVWHVYGKSWTLSAKEMTKLKIISVISHITSYNNLISNSADILKHFSVRRGIYGTQYNKSLIAPPIILTRNR